MSSEGLIQRYTTPLKDALFARQDPETVTRSSTIKWSESEGIEDIDPPDDIDNLYALYEDIGLIRASLNQFVSDVTEPGVRVEADDDTTKGWFMGDEDAPDFAPEGGFLNQCYVLDQTHQPFRPLLAQSVLNRWARGTFLSERLKEDNEDPESDITGFKPIRPETVSARTYENTNLLVHPDPEHPANENLSPKLTPRDEAAAYVQFDDQSILGRRIGGFEETSRPLSQNDVFKVTLDQNIGGAEPEDGVFGVSIIAAIEDDAKEYRDIKRDLTKAIRGKAWPLWDFEFETTVIETPEGELDELIQWDETDIDNYMDEVDKIDPGDMVGHDGSITLNSHTGEVPDIRDILKHYVDEILTPLPAPKFTIGFETDINQFVTEQQNERYQQIINDERRVQAQAWGDEFKEVAERHDNLNPSGLVVKIEPREEESPVMNLSEADLDRLETFANAVESIYGSGMAPAFLDEETILHDILQLPEESGINEEDIDIDDITTGE